jgi:signal transduction histidine kinase
MNSNKLNLLIDLYTDANLPVLITDKDLKVIWKNNNSFLGNLDITDLSLFLEFEINENTAIVPVAIEEDNFILNVFRITEKGDTEGFIITCLTYSDIKKMNLNKNYIDNQISFFSSIRHNVSGIVSVASLLQRSLEDKEMYDELEYLNLQINYCYKILADSVNPTEVTKYFYGLYNIRKLDAGIFIKDVIGFLNNIIRNPDVNITYTCEDNVKINIDSDRFLIALLNIIINAISYNISEKKEIKISLKKSDGFANLLISDNGIGIPDAVVNNVMNSNCCSNKAYSKEKIGSSICGGLEVVSRFCKAFNCKMMISTKENEGTTIALKIPLAYDNEYPEYLNSDTAEYIINRFSNIYLLASKVCQIKYI